MPRNSADWPSSSSMRRSWLYLAMRSVRDAEPVLIWPAPVPTVADDAGVAEAATEFDGFEGLGDGADLVDLDEDGVAALLLDAHLEALGVGDEEVVADELNVAEDLGHVLPAVPVVFGEAVFDGDDGVLIDPGLPVGDHLFGGEFALVRLLEDVLAGLLVVELAGGGVEGDGDVFAGGVAGEFDGFDDEIEGLVVGLEAGSEAAFVADGGGVALLLEDAFEGVEDFGAPAEGVGEVFSADGHDHELLEVDVGVCVGAAVEDVHHGRGEEAGVDAAEVAVERELEREGRGAGAGHGDGEDGVGSEPGLVLGAVDGDHGGVDEALVGGVHAGEFGGEDGLYVFNGLEDTFAEVVLLVAVAEFDRFVLAGGGSAGDSGAATDAAFEDDVGFDCGVAAGVQNFTRLDRDDLGHIAPIVCSCWVLGDNPMGEPVIKFGATIHGNCATASNGDGIHEFNTSRSHKGDSSKATAVLAEGAMN
jgi:hypothetical protein